MFLPDLRSSVCSTQVVLLSSAIVSLLFSPTVFAQRGFGHYQQSQPTTTPLTGFPGFFDANMAGKNGFVFDLPSASIDYGVTENLTIGSTALLALPLAFGTPMLYGKARYRFFSDKQISSALTLYGGFLYKKSTNSAGHSLTTNATLAVASNNTTFYLTERTTLNVFLFAGLLYGTVGTPRDLEYTRGIFNFTFAGINFQHWITDWLGPQLVVLSTLHYDANIDSTSATLTTNNGILSASKNFVFVRGLFEFRIENWLLSPGVVAVFSPGTGESSMGPFLAGTVKW